MCRIVVAHLVYADLYTHHLEVCHKVPKIDREGRQRGKKWLEDHKVQCPACDILYDPDYYFRQHVTSTARRGKEVCSKLSTNIFRRDPIATKSNAAQKKRARAPNGVVAEQAGVAPQPEVDAIAPRRSERTSRNSKPKYAGHDDGNSSDVTCSEPDDLDDLSLGDSSLDDSSLGDSSAD